MLHKISLVPIIILVVRFRVKISALSEHSWLQFLSSQINPNPKPVDKAEMGFQMNASPVAL